MTSESANPYMSSTAAAGTRANRSSSLLAHFFSPSGRANRETYIVNSLFNALVAIGLSYVVLRIGLLLGPTATTVAFLMVFVICAASIWISIALAAKRLHDIGRPTWHSALLLLPLYNIYLGMVLSVQRGTIGISAQGADPTQTGLADEEALIDSAYQYEMQGDWNHALVLYRIAAQKLAGQPPAEYVANCIHRVEEKMKSAGFIVVNLD